jgi:fatty-acyl-CoA synthase
VNWCIGVTGAQVVPELERSPAGSLTSATVPSLKHVIIMSEQQRPGAIRCCSLDSLKTETLFAIPATRFQDVMSHAGSGATKRVAELSDRIQMDDACNIQFTSGTTGNPKGVTLSHHNLVNNAFFIGHRIGYNTEVGGGAMPALHCTPGPPNLCVGAVLPLLR